MCCCYGNLCAKSGCAPTIVRQACSKIFQATYLCFYIIVLGDVCTDFVCVVKDFSTTTFVKIKKTLFSVYKYIKNGNVSSVTHKITVIKTLVKHIGPT